MATTTELKVEEKKTVSAVTLRVFRFDPEKDKESRYDTFSSACQTRNVGAGNSF